MRTNASPEVAPSPMTGQARLIRAAYEGGDLEALARQILSLCRDGELEAGSALDLATILMLSHKPVEALAFQAQVLQSGRHFSLRSNGTDAATRVLIIVTAGDLMANTPVDFLLDNPDFAVEYFYVLVGEELPEELPEHDVTIVGVAYSGVSAPLLVALSQAARNWRRPLINHPDNVLKTSRHGIADALHDAKGVLAPPVFALDRSQWAAADYRLPGTLDYPVLVRPLDTHAGIGLNKIASLKDLERYMESCESDAVYVTQFVDYKTKDEVYIKYRIALIDGEPYLCHMALRSHWMVHYLNADMSQDASKRAAEATAMANFDLVFVPRHRTAFTEIHLRTGIDYLVIDCSEAPDGRLLVFEADTGMIVHDMDDPETYPYKLPQMRKIFDAFQNAIRNRQRACVPS